MNKLIILASSLFLFLAACDEIKGPYEEDAIVPAGDRKVLLEDFTGHKCGNCPNATKEAIKLDSIFEGRVIVVATHCSFFADTNIAGKYTTNFKIPMGEKIDKDFGVELAGLPKGMVNRTIYNGKKLLNFGDWSSAVLKELSVAPDVNIALTSTYDTSSRYLKVDAEVEYVKRGSSDLKIVICLIEDKVVDWQLDYSKPSGQQDIPNYVHRHVLREPLTPIYGERISATDVVAGKKIKKTFTIDNLSTKYNAKNCSIVAYVLSGAEGQDDTRKVLQAEEVHLY